jgi:hypothetical protein
LRLRPAAPLFLPALIVFFPYINAKEQGGDKAGPSDGQKKRPA